MLLGLVNGLSVPDLRSRVQLLHPVWCSFNFLNLATGSVLANIVLKYIKLTYIVNGYNNINMMHWNMDVKLIALKHWQYDQCLRWESITLGCPVQGRRSIILECPKGRRNPFSISLMGNDPIQLLNHLFQFPRQNLGCLWCYH